MTCFENSVPERPFRAYLACLASGKARHVKTTKKTPKNNAVRLGLPKLGERGLFVLLFFGGRTHSKTKPTANGPQPTPYAPPQLC